MGWIFPLLYAGLVFTGFGLLRLLNRQMIELILFAVLIALAGYAWQGSPGLSGMPVILS